jgi:hypothetical protein
VIETIMRRLIVVQYPPRRKEEVEGGKGGRGGEGRETREKKGGEAVAV